jgi:predicted GNAT family acetyltransferase
MLSCFPYFNFIIIIKTCCADKLVKELALHLRENKIKAVSTCSYAIDWFEKHPEFKDVCR